jgi:hypothetical protein
MDSPISFTSSNNKDRNMPEFNFYGSWTDTLKMLSKILNTKLYKIIINTGYKRPSALELTSFSEDAIELLKKNHSVFLWSENYSYFSLKFGPPNGQGSMAIRQLESGPVLDLSLADVYHDQGRSRVGQGLITYPPYFIHPETNKSYPPPEPLKRAYQSLKSLLKKDMVKRYWWHNVFSTTTAEYEPHAEIFWIGLDAMRLMETEKYYIRWGQDTWIKASDLEISLKKEKPSSIDP